MTTHKHSPLVAVALHDGHEVRSEVAKHLSISDSDRRREEDPFTGEWTTMGGTRIVVKRSRFEVDLNRPRSKAVYLKPQDAWGLTVWKHKPPADLVERSLAQYDVFYTMMERVCTEMTNQFGKFVIFDLHTYNHRRDGIDAAPADAKRNPEINIGTGSMDRVAWAPVVDRFIDDLRSFSVLGRKFDVRENVKFAGGQFPRWVHERFPNSACVIAIEVKKFFMDEWTHQRDMTVFNAIHHALQSPILGVLSTLQYQK